MEITILGSGTSSGIPVIGCSCKVCLSNDSRDKRLRSSVYIDLGESEESGLRYILIDCGPDFREQALRHNLPRIDAILFTHAHADHIFGLDDIRIYNFKQKSPIPLFADQSTRDSLNRIFSYCFIKNLDYEGGGIPSLILNEIKPLEDFKLGHINITPIKIFHGKTPILGFKVGSFAYLTDCSSVPDESMPFLEDLDLLIVSGLRHRPHATHYTVEGAMNLIKTLNPKRAYLTHISHDLLHSDTDESLKIEASNTNLAYDGLTIGLG